MSNKPPKDFSELNIRKKAFRGIIQRLCGDVNEKNRFFWKIVIIDKNSTNKAKKLSKRRFLNEK